MAHQKVDQTKADGKVDGSEAEDKFNRLVSSTNTMLGSVHSKHVKASSISEVPEQLRKSKKEAYMPKVVSIGPLHNRTRKELLYMEEIKWSYVVSLLQVRVPGDDAKKRLMACSRVIYDLDEIVRTSYADDIKFNGYDLAKILLLDACFLLELLMMSDRKEFEQHRVKSELEEVLSDLVVLENQIPLLLLNVLFHRLFEGDAEYDDAAAASAREVVNKLVLSLFGYSSTKNSSNSAHILELIHSHLTAGKQEQSDQTSSDVSIPVDAIQKTKPKLTCCATMLIAAGVTINPLCSEPGARIELGCDFKFSKQNEKWILEIQRLPISERTEAMWRNFIAWEHSRTTHEKFRAMKQGTRTICKFSEYALLFKGLICCEHDIHLLKKQGVLLVNDAERSNEDLVTMFSKITKGLEDVQMDTDSGLVRVFEDLNKHSSTETCAVKNGKIMWHFVRRYLTAFGNFCRNWFNVREFIRDYCPTGWKLIVLIFAVVVSVTSVINTVLSIYQLIQPVNSRSSGLSSKGLAFRFVD